MSCHAVKIKVYLIILWEHAVANERTGAKRPVRILNSDMLIKYRLLHVIEHVTSVINKKSKQMMLSGLHHIVTTSMLA